MKFVRYITSSNVVVSVRGKEKEVSINEYIESTKPKSKRKPKKTNTTATETDNETSDPK